MNIKQVKDRVALKLEKQVCPVHGKHPKISWNGDTVKAECCCDAFRSRIGDLAANFFAEEVGNELVKNLK